MRMRMRTSNDVRASQQPEQHLTGNFPHLEGSNQPPSAAWLRGARVTWLDYVGWRDAPG